MTETRPAPSRNQTAALVGLLTVVTLVSLSPVGTQLLFPMIGQTIGTAWAEIIRTGTWIGSDVIVPVLTWIGGLFS